MEVVQRPKFKNHFNNLEISQLLKLFNVYGELIEVTSEVKLSRDPKDDFLLSLAKDSGANYLVTGDRDLLDLIRIGKTKIITISAFLDKLK